ncbi:MAG TPA: hypothetical protein DD415_05610 [Clostridiales bacterium]|nr:hypothetical protein [Clostridiales bacterium]
MKKIFKTLAVCAVAGTLCAGVAAMAGCAEKTETFTGEYKYDNAWTPGDTYGVKVKVEVKGDKITKVTYQEDTDHYVNVSPSWQAGVPEGSLGATATKEKAQKYLDDTFVGKTVKEVKDLKVAVDATGAPIAVTKDNNKQTLDSAYILSGATQTSGRFVLAIQNALNDIHTGDAFGLVHGAGYAGFASVTVKAGAITDVQLSEVCLPTYVTIPNDDTTIGADYKVKATVKDHGKDVEKTFYKTVTFGSVTMTYDVTKGYVVGDKTMVEFFQDAQNVKTYYKAVMAGKVAVVVGEGNEGKKTDVMTKAALSKEENGYWASANGSVLTPATGKTYWMANRDATCKYVKEHGVDNLLNLARADAENVHSFWMDGTVSTGATWSDMNSKNTTNYVSYAQLIKNAFDAKY